jgi:hypothetical protein
MLPALSNWTKNWPATAAGVLLASLIATAASAADHPVSSDAQLRAALNPSGGAQDGDTITLANDITLQGDLPVVQRSVKLVGKNFALLGQGKYRGLFVYAGTVQISDLTIKDTRAQGGNGGNGLNNGAGGGGGSWAGRSAVRAHKRGRHRHQRQCAGKFGGGRQRGRGERWDSRQLGRRRRRLRRRWRTRYRICPLYLASGRRRRRVWRRCNGRNSRFAWSA